MTTQRPYTEIDKCRICGSSDLVEILNLGDMALTGIFPRNAADAVTTGPIELVKCVGVGACGLVQLRQSYRFDEMYGDNYGYRSGLNASMVAHLERKVRRIADFVKLAHTDFVIDIGSNDGTLLGAYDLVDHGRAWRMGVDPTAAKFSQYYKSFINIFPAFFSAKLLLPKSKIITSIAMFYDLESPLDFMADVRASLTDDGVWVFEQSYLPTMIDRLAYDTVCHEHLEFYCLKQIKWLCDKAGFKIVDVELNDVNGGSFSVMVAKDNAPYPEMTDRLYSTMIVQESEPQLSDRLLKFFGRVASHRNQLRAFVGEARQAGKKIYGYGASTKGNVVLQYCGLTAADIVAVAEVNEEKFGHYTPGSRIPIIPEALARAQRPDYFLVLPWHFREGFIEREREYLRSGGKLVFALPELTIVEEV